MQGHITNQLVHSFSSSITFSQPTKVISSVNISAVLGSTNICDD